MGIGRFIFGKTTNDIIDDVLEVFERLSWVFWDHGFLEERLAEFFVDLGVHDVYIIISVFIPLIANLYNYENYHSNVAKTFNHKNQTNYFFSGS